ncbi:unnamed protein product [Symbiodinium natans]|uniref:Uncharacterized protein n=1 Tax=Symbiodinium natans TaxID=878477 RepID=A0A812RF58_9DINO|nr:unnamed protein product [Symbiodinium natans]
MTAAAAGQRRWAEWANFLLRRDGRSELLATERNIRAVVSVERSDNTQRAQSSPTATRKGRLGAKRAQEEREPPYALKAGADTVIEAAEGNRRAGLAGSHRMSCVTLQYEESVTAKGVGTAQFEGTQGCPELPAEEQTW